MGILKDEFETTSLATGGSKTGDVITRFASVLLLALIVGLPVGYMFSIDFYKVLAVSLALATLCSLHPLLDAGWFGIPLGMTEIGLVAAVLVWLVFGTGFFTVIGVFLVLGILITLLMGEPLREEVRGGPEQALTGIREEQRQREVEQEQLEWEKRSYRPSRSDDGGEHTIPIRPHELRALSYKEYLQTPHWKRKREDKLRTVGRRCQLCNRGSGTLDVHHRTYERLGEELDQDLTVLCRACHTTFHEHRRLGR